MLPVHLCVGAGHVGGEVKLGHAASQSLPGHHHTICQHRRADVVVLPIDLVRGIQRPLFQQLQDKLRSMDLVSECQAVHKIAEADR